MPVNKLLRESIIGYLISSNERSGTSAALFPDAIQSVQVQAVSLQQGYSRKIGRKRIHWRNSNIYLHIAKNANPPELPAEKAYPLRKVPINQKKTDDIKKLMSTLLDMKPSTTPSSNGQDLTTTCQNSCQKMNRPDLLYTKHIM
ncbi:hypothetical protein WA026_016880 [Henosepilachna vigintioctopunctata]|uniref:Uncharacterized protein n=1 Tax=Henosepilachna vigintioctopunctata TaxID=420089 RepID=A0AAW1TZW5_9CUCU